MAIDVGNAAINRNSTFAGAECTVDRNNPANASGRITSVEIWANASLSNCKVATFFVVSANNLSTNDYHAIGSVTAGSKQTFSGLSIAVETNEMIGMYASSGTMEQSNDVGAAGKYAIGGDGIPCTNQNFSIYTPRTISLYGTGIVVKQLAETFSTTDSLIKNVTRNLSETILIVDDWAIVLRLSEVLSVIDSYIRNVTKNLADTFSIADSLFNRLKLSETLQAVDSFARTFYLAEAFSIADSHKTSIIWIEEAKATIGWTEESKNTIVWDKESNNIIVWDEEIKI